MTQQFFTKAAFSITWPLHLFPNLMHKLTTHYFNRIKLLLSRGLSVKLIPHIGRKPQAASLLSYKYLFKYKIRHRRRGRTMLLWLLITLCRFFFSLVFFHFCYQFWKIKERRWNLHHGLYVYVPLQWAFFNRVSALKIFSWGQWHVLSSLKVLG